jgi:hypothetical protein
MFVYKTITYAIQGFASNITKLLFFEFPNNHTKNNNRSSIEQDWEKIGNDMRISILNYDRKQIGKFSK